MFKRILHLLRQTLQGLCPQFLRHPVKGFGNAAGDAGKGVAVTAQRDCIAERIFKAGAFQKATMASGTVC